MNTLTLLGIKSLFPIKTEDPNDWDSLLRKLIN